MTKIKSFEVLNGLGGEYHVGCLGCVTGGRKPKLFIFCVQIFQMTPVPTFLRMIHVEHVRCILIVWIWSGGQGMNLHFRPQGPASRLLDDHRSKEP